MLTPMGGRWTKNLRSMQAGAAWSNPERIRAVPIITTMTIQIKRAYDPPSNDDGCRVLVDRVWPRAVRKERAHIDKWLKDVAPSTALRKWFGHDPAKWKEFEKRYFAELDDRTPLVDELFKLANQGPVTFIYGAKDETHNNAVALKNYIGQRA
jgi:uncharacterized protein YeaO (DUF488 family)